jgi:hypothetical protein
VGKVEANGRIGEAADKFWFSVPVFSKLNGICGSAGVSGQNLLQKHPRGPADMPVFFKYKPVDFLFFPVIEQVVEPLQQRRIPNPVNVGIKKSNLVRCRLKSVQGPIPIKKLLQSVTFAFVYLYVSFFCTRMEANSFSGQIKWVKYLFGQILF